MHTRGNLPKEAGGWVLRTVDLIALGLPLNSGRTRAEGPLQSPQPLSVPLNRSTLQKNRQQQALLLKEGHTPGSR